ncbi:hypothetical protein MMC13_002508 [Lambiella insularis]|nr:hypothetical protein [Lambiella insularis]
MPTHAHPQPTHSKRPHAAPKHSKKTTTSPIMTAALAPTGGPVFFWREFEHPYGFLSQWYPAAFTAPSPIPHKPAMTFSDTEQYMMYHKAVLFQDWETAEKIMLATTPKEYQRLGRQVKGFDKGLWDANKERIVEEGNWYKFTETKGENLRKKLLELGERELVEASPADRIWGVGFKAETAEANRAKWGENLLGKAIMRVRTRLMDRDQG